MSTVSLYLKEVKARLTGDTNLQIATRNERVTRNGINQQISNLESKLARDEFAIEEAQDKLNDIKYPTTQITDVESYLERVLEQETKIQGLEKTKETTEKLLTYWKNAKEEWFKEVKE